MTSSWTAADFADLESTMKAVSIFATLRADLMRARAFMVRSTLEPKSLDKGGPRRFVGVEEKNHGHIHNWAVLRICITLLRQALSCYDALKRIKPRLEDPDVERVFVYRVAA